MSYAVIHTKPTLLLRLLKRLYIHVRLVSQRWALLMGVELGGTTLQLLHALQLRCKNCAKQIVLL